MMLRSLILSFTLIYTLPVFAFDHNFGLWKRVVTKYVDYSTVPATVDYLGIKNNRLDFTENLQEMVKVTEAEYKAFTVDQRKAFILNLYGAIAIKAVLDQIDGKTLPKSIKDASRILNDIFDKKIFKLFDKKRSLNYIENELAEEFKTDFKFMVAFACTAKSCPPPGYYTAESLTKTLNEVMKSFLSYDKNANYTMETNKFVACDYFEPREKYMKYSKEYSSLKDFLIRNAPISELLKDKALKNENSLDLDFTKMDWSLSAKPAQ
ncbi:hypothetical protein CIK05_07620 [Bdellovibrio sp. qaytius]|nr:hypothetical protein CIK05_07620 [Bdellovibrio sp. qaytius]